MAAWTEKRDAVLIDDIPGFPARDKHGVWIFLIKEDFHYALNPRLVRSAGIRVADFSSRWLQIRSDGTITVRRDYAWNGASPKISVLDLFILGTPDGIPFVHKLADGTFSLHPKAYYATLVHDVLYQYMYFHSITRKQADRIFLELLKASRFAPRAIYHLFVRAFGWMALLGRKKRVANFKRAHPEIFAGHSR